MPGEGKMESGIFDDIKEKVLPVAEEIRWLNEKVPDMTEREFAWEHNWISDEDLEEAKNTSRQMVALMNKELATVRRIERRHPDEFRLFMKELLMRLQQSWNELKERVADIENRSGYEDLISKAEFHAIHLETLATCLQGWYKGEETRHAPAWAWGHVFEAIDGAGEIAGKLAEIA